MLFAGALSLDTQTILIERLLSCFVIADIDVAWLRASVEASKRRKQILWG